MISCATFLTTCFKRPADDSWVYTDITTMLLLIWKAPLETVPQYTRTFKMEEKTQ